MRKRTIASQRYNFFPILTYKSRTSKGSIFFQRQLYQEPMEGVVEYSESVFTAFPVKTQKISDLPRVANYPTAQANAS